MRTRRWATGFFFPTTERAIFSEWDRLGPDDFPDSFPRCPISLRAPVRGKRGAAPTSAPSASPPSTRRAWDACLSRRAAVCLRTLGPVTITTTGPAATLPWPSQARESCVLRPNSAPVHAGTLVNVALRSLVLSRDPCPRMHRKSANGRGPVPPSCCSTGHPLSVSVACSLSPLGASSPHYPRAQKHALSRGCISNRRIGTRPSAESPSLARLNERTRARRGLRHF